MKKRVPGEGYADESGREKRGVDVRVSSHERCELGGGRVARSTAQKLQVSMRERSDMHYTEVKKGGGRVKATQRRFGSVSTAVADLGTRRHIQEVLA